MSELGTFYEPYIGSRALLEDLHSCQHSARASFKDNTDQGLHESGDWKQLHNEELLSLYRSPNIVRVIKSRRLRWAGHVAKNRKVGVLYKF